MSVEGAGGSGVLVGRAPVPAGVRMLLVFGGTFDPPHRAHLELPMAALAACGGDWVLYVPAGRSPHKADGPRAGDADRVEMLRAGLEEIGAAGRASIGTLELDRPGPSYTVETLEALRGEIPAGCVMRLLIGADQARVFHSWREARRIIGLAEPLVMPREPLVSAGEVAGALAASGAWSEGEVRAWESRVLATVVMPAQATDVRAGLANEGLDGAAARGLLSEGVRRVIRERGLYGLGRPGGGGRP
ncbi:MAG: nicotinate-nicotinamide nucleotide adenylyltransferase [Planctomycetota bacterium]|nr:nicotinate-nicotinamide nucleotide adenylyltransferase [Planctomycetota bacterium]